jgi:protein phosphatase PTC7
MYQFVCRHSRLTGFAIPDRLWSRLILHFWALEIESRGTCASRPDPVEFLQRAYEQTIVATTSPNEWFGTTTSVTGLLHYQTEANGHLTPLLYVTNLGDCQLMVIRPRDGEEENVVFRTKGQWHWFDCPMQLGTNSVDTPRQNAVLSTLALEERDIIVAVSDGVTDNLWEHEVSKVVLDSVLHWATRGKDEGPTEADLAVAKGSAMVYAAQQLLLAARAVAQDPFAQTPYMEKALEEGLAIEGGMYSGVPDCFGGQFSLFF